MGKFDCTRQYYRCNMTLSVTMFLGLMLALTVSGKPKTYLIETVDNADILEEAKPKISPNHGYDYSWSIPDPKAFAFGIMGQKGFKLKPGLTPLQQCKRFLKAVAQGQTYFKCNPCRHESKDVAMVRCGSAKRNIFSELEPIFRFSRNDVEVTLD